ncbi:MAG: hypothetical protein GSR78_02865 [Desulfurococcales archaeon]|nr:hypothetical protein [Desulfurococcales archaeon]
MNKILQRMIVGQPQGEYASWLDEIGAAKSQAGMHDARKPSDYLELHLAEEPPACNVASQLAHRGAFITWHQDSLGGIATDVIQGLSRYGRIAAGSVMSREAAWGVRALRAAATVADLKTVALSGDSASLVSASQALSLDIVYIPGDELAPLLREGLEYAPLYVDTYLSQYYSLEGLSESDAHKMLGLYLAARSLIEHTGANSILLDCRELKDYHPLAVIALMLDEGIPASCTSSYHGLAVQATSLALTGKPAIIKEGDVMVTPTLVSTSARLIQTNLGLAPTGQARDIGVWVTVRGKTAYIASVGGAYGLQTGLHWPVALAYAYLGFKTPGVPVPASLVVYKDGEKISRIL